VISFAHGADETIDYRSEIVEARIAELTRGVGLDIAIDLLGPDNGGRLLRLLAYGGRLFSVAGVPKPEALADFPRGCSLHDVALGWAYLAKGARALEGLRRIAGHVAELAITGELGVPIERRVSFEQIPGALLASKASHQRGRVVGIVDDALAAG
jgi:NADPH:quinone reductase-like Zn-dependent oxidoreductase